MARGFLGGALMGGVLSIGAATGVALVLPPLTVATPPKISDDAPVPAVAPQDADTALPRIAAEPDAPQVPSVTTVKDAPAPAPDVAVVLDDTPAQSPQIGDVSGLAVPEGTAQGSDVAVSQDAPVLPNPQALAPMLPQEADDVVIVTAPAALPAVEGAGAGVASTTPEAETAKPPQEETLQEPVVVAEAETAPTPETPTLETPTPETPTPETVEVAAEEPVTETTVAENDIPATGADATPQAADVAAGAGTETLTLAEAASVAPSADTPTDEEIAEATSDITLPANDTPAPQTDASDGTAPEQTSPEENADAQVAVTTPVVRPRIGTPAISLTDRNAGVAINRPNTDADVQEDAPVTVITQEGTDGVGRDPRPVVRFAQPFKNAEDKPLMSIVLIDDGTNPASGAAGIAALSSFPYTLSFAVDTSLPDAKERMAIYRNEGFEVLAMIDLPEGAQPTDVETTMGVTLSQMGDVVGVLEGPAAGLQASRDVADQVTAILAQSGHGLVAQDKGLNTMPKLARKEGVPADPIFRDFDSKGQTATVIRRFLDQAAFKAGQEGAVIMLGRLRADTISALLLWGLQDRAGQVALAPISAVLLRDDVGG